MNLGIDIHLPAPLVFHQEVPLWKSHLQVLKSQAAGTASLAPLHLWLGWVLRVCLKIGDTNPLEHGDNPLEYEIHYFQTKPLRRSYDLSNLQEVIDSRTQSVQYFCMDCPPQNYPLVMTNIAIENCPFIDDLPMKNGWIFPWQTGTNNQRVSPLSFNGSVAWGDRCGSLVQGTRFKCLVCPDFDLCEACLRKGCPVMKPCTAEAEVHQAWRSRVLFPLWWSMGH